MTATQEFTQPIIPAEAQPTDTYVEPVDEFNAGVVFDAVYSVMAKAQQNKERYQSPERLDPAVDFCAERFEYANKYLAGLESQAMRPSDVKEDMVGRAKIRAEEVYAGRSPATVGARMQRAGALADTFVGRASEMYRDGGADPLVIKMFFNGLGNLGIISSVGYNDVIRKSDEEVPDGLSQASYKAELAGLIAGHADVIEENGWIFFNGEKGKRRSTPDTLRTYISARINGRPEEVVKNWTEALDGLGIEGQIVYKVQPGISRRYETVVVYSDDDSQEDVSRALERFSEICPDNLLSETVLLSGKKVAKGVVQTPSPGDLSRLLSYAGEEDVSYNQLVCAFTEMALRRSAYAFASEGKSAAEVNPKKLSERAKPCFAQFIKLAGIDPDTMQVISS